LEEARRSAALARERTGGAFQPEDRTRRETR